MGDRSLDDFLDGDSGDGDGDGPDESPDRSESAADDSVDTDDDDLEEAETSVDDETEVDTGGDDGETGDEDDGVRVDPTTVEPAEATYAWSGDGGTCAACGETVDRRWRSDDGLVCPDCKEW
ncbi:DUF7573 domain-containing protein [Halosimplex pelagicum]|uniref:DUF7573 domain-containing protein n=1 Tax=Halosimplex pelagicum TaxID=869886 RepID=A0A7D5PAC2_9EURY|nr:hypothetical protein [Halosimplex pelagicum]QLH81462.1 hypothetical protein HZS54_07395 [Halosimplex pelagicum]